MCVSVDEGSKICGGFYMSVGCAMLMGLAMFLGWGVFVEWGATEEWGMCVGSEMLIECAVFEGGGCL